MAATMSTAATLTIASTVDTWLQASIILSTLWAFLLRFAQQQDARNEANGDGREEVPRSIDDYFRNGFSGINVTERAEWEKLLRSIEGLGIPTAAFQHSPNKLLGDPQLLLRLNTTLQNIHMSVCVHSQSGKPQAQPELNLPRRACGPTLSATVPRIHYNGINFASFARHGVDTGFYAHPEDIQPNANVRIIFEEKIWKRLRCLRKSPPTVNIPPVIPPGLGSDALPDSTKSVASGSDDGMATVTTYSSDDGGSIDGVSLHGGSTSGISQQSRARSPVIPLNIAKIDGEYYTKMESGPLAGSYVTLQGTMVIGGVEYMKEFLVVSHDDNVEVNTRDNSEIKSAPVEKPVQNSLAGKTVHIAKALPAAAATPVSNKNLLGARIPSAAATTSAGKPSSPAKAPPTAKVHSAAKVHPAVYPLPAAKHLPATRIFLLAVKTPPAANTSVVNPWTNFRVTIAENDKQLAGDKAEARAAREEREAIEGVKGPEVVDIWKRVDLHPDGKGRTKVKAVDSKFKPATISRMTFGDKTSSSLQASTGPKGSLGAEIYIKSVAETAPVAETSPVEQTLPVTGNSCLAEIAPVAETSLVPQTALTLPDAKYALSSTPAQRKEWADENRCRRCGGPHDVNVCELLPAKRSPAVLGAARMANNPRRDFGLPKVQHTNIIYRGNGKIRGAVGGGIGSGTGIAPNPHQHTSIPRLSDGNCRGDMPQNRRGGLGRGRGIDRGGGGTDRGRGGTGRGRGGTGRGRGGTGRGRGGTGRGHGGTGRGGIGQAGGFAGVNSIPLPPRTPAAGSTSQLPISRSVMSAYNINDTGAFLKAMARKPSV